MVGEILYEQFYDLSTDEKIKIILQGRPRPTTLRESIVYDGNTMPVEKFYEQEKCLAICERTGNIFCFPCLLFPIGIDSPENRALVSNIEDQDLHKLILRHKNSPPHIHGLLQYALFRKKYSQNFDVLSDVRKEGWLIKKNNDNAVLQRIIDGCCSLLSSPSPLDANDDVLKVEKCIQILRTLTKSYDTHIVEEAANLNLVKTHSTMLTDIVDAIAQVMKENIKSELKSTSSVALILSKHSNCENNSKLSTVIRYVYDGQTYERLIDLANLDACADAAGIQQHISKLICEYEISQKFLAVSCDGAVLSTKYLCEFVAAFLKQNPLHFFLPSHFHDFSHVIEQSLSRHPKVNRFFKNLNSMKAFFQNNSEACDILDVIAKGEIPNLNNLKLNNFQFLRLLKLYRRQFLEVYGHIIEHHGPREEDITKAATGFQTILEQYETVFMLEAFFMLFNRFAALSEMSSSSSAESVLNRRFLKSINTVLTSDRNRGFESLWTNVINELLMDSKPETLAAVGEEETKQLQELYMKIVNCIMKEINIRLSSAGRLEFLSTLNSETDGKLIISDFQMESLMTLTLQGTLLDKNRLKTELVILSRNGAVFGGKSIGELMDILMKADLQRTFKNVYKLAELILTMPCKAVSLQSSGASKLDMINAWQSNPNTLEMHFFCQLCIEQDYLKLLKSRTTFYGEVMLKLKESSNSVKELKLLL